MGMVYAVPIFLLMTSKQSVSELCSTYIAALTSRLEINWK